MRFGRRIHAGLYKKKKGTIALIGYEKDSPLARYYAKEAKKKGFDIWKI